MVSLTADLAQSMLHLSDSDIDNTNMEYLIDLAIKTLNLLGNLELSTMGGTVASKTVSVTDKQEAAIMIALRAIYHGFYKGLENATIGGLTVSPTDLFSNKEVLDTIREAAQRLQEHDWGDAFI